MSLSRQMAVEVLAENGRRLNPRYIRLKSSRTRIRRGGPSSDARLHRSQHMLSRTMGVLFILRVVGSVKDFVGRAPSLVLTSVLSLFSPVVCSAPPSTPTSHPLPLTGKYLPSCQQVSNVHIFHPVIHTLVMQLHCLGEMSSMRSCPSVKSILFLHSTRPKPVMTTKRKTTFITGYLSVLHCQPSSLALVSQARPFHSSEWLGLIDLFLFQSLSQPLAR